MELGLLRPQTVGFVGQALNKQRVNIDLRHAWQVSNCRTRLRAPLNSRPLGQGMQIIAESFQQILTVYAETSVRLKGVRL